MKNRGINLFSNFLWGFSIVFLNALFLYIFRDVNPYLSLIFLFLSSLIITLTVEPSNYFLSPVFYILSKFLLLFVHSYLSFLHNPWFLIYLLNGDIFRKPQKILKTKTLMIKSLDSFKILPQFRVGLLEMITVIIGVSSAFLIKKFIFKEDEHRIILKEIKNNYLLLLLFGIFSFLLFHTVSFFSIILYNIHFKYIFSLYLLVSSIIGSMLFLKGFWRSVKRGNKLLLLYPLIFYYISMLLVSPIGFIVNLLTRIIVFPFEGSMVFIGSLFPFIFNKMKGKDEIL